MTIIYSMWAIRTECKQTLFLDNVSLNSQRMVPELLTLTLCKCPDFNFRKIWPQFLAK